MSEERIKIKDVTPKPKPKYTNVGADNHIYVRAMQGVFQRLRKYMGWFFMLLFLLLPLFQWDGHQAILLNIVEQRIHIFALTIFPQDLMLLALLLIVCAFGLFFITAYLGRVWCGFMCPQTIWTFIFIWFEEKIEGSANKRLKLNQAPWSADKVKKKLLKHTAWLGFSVFTGLAFTAYFVPIYDLYIDFFTLQGSGTVYFWVLFFAFCTYGNAGWMRTIMCTHMCPYARFQSAMFDSDTLIVGYNFQRGEDRGPRARKADYKGQGLGDCIDCNLCVQVCPAGIDIRDGLQYECINCGACVDACDQTMERMNYPKGLISYTSENVLNNKPHAKSRFKFVGYGIVMVVMSLFFVISVMNIAPVQLDIIRDRNSLYRENADGNIENTYTLKIINKTTSVQTYQLSVTDIPEYEWFGPREVKVLPGELLVQPISLAIDPYDLDKSVLKINFVVTELGEDHYQFTQQSRFISQL
jgi:cytochrome c oxidase accessory protein FixG